METEVVDPEHLKFFTPFHSLSDAQLDYISVNAKVLKLQSNKTILELNSNSHDKYLLLEGSLKLTSLDKNESIIKANTERAKNPVAQLRPSRFKVTTVSPSKILILKDDFLDTAIEQSEMANSSASYSITETILDEEHEEDLILYELILELQQGNFILPSLPDVAIRIRETIANEDSGADDIARVIQTDPAIATKIMKVANSALYQRGKRVHDCRTAVARIGTKVIQQLVVAFAAKELFQSSNTMLNKRMKQVWEHSVEIAALSFILAKVTPGFNAEQALLAGLIHDIGVVAIVNKAIEHPSITDSEVHLNNVIHKMHAQVGASILRRWDFSDDIIAAAEETEDWFRTGSEKADLVDIVNIAHMHSYISSPTQRKLPVIDQMPAFHKMALGQLTPGPDHTLS
jgi:putative nucleotidyltransferase with HDIG domain